MSRASSPAVRRSAFARRAIALLALASCCSSCSATGGTRDSDCTIDAFSVAATAGRRDFSHDDGGPVDSRGIEFSGHSANHEVAGVLSYDASTAHVHQAPSSGSGRVAVDVEEVLIGLRVAVIDVSDELHVFTGGGLGFIDGDAGDGALSNVSSQAGYVELGLQLALGAHFEAGLDLRALWGAKLDLDTAELDPDYVQAALRMGWSF